MDWSDLKSEKEVLFLLKFCRFCFFGFKRRRCDIYVYVYMLLYIGYLVI